MDEIVTGTPDLAPEQETETEHDDVDVVLEIEDESSGEQDDSQTEAPPTPRKLKVKIDGQELEVDEDEAVKGYQRQADYSRHMQRLQAEQAEARQLRETYQQRIGQFIPDQLVKLQHMQAELQDLAVSDPAAWVARQQEFQIELARYQQANAESERLKQEKEAETQQSMRALYQRAEQAVFESIPEWKNPETRAKEASEIGQILHSEISRFFGPETDRIMGEINEGYYGPLPILLARKAMQYDALMAKVAARKGKTSDQTTAPEPVTPLRSKGAATKDPDKMSTSEWMAWRNKQVRSA